MKIKVFKGLEETYPEKVDETDSWYYTQITPCSEAYEVPDFNNQYSGTRLCLIEYPSGRIFEPIKQEGNVFLERPVYDKSSDAFGIIRYDFNEQMMQALLFKPGLPGVEVLAEMAFDEVNNIANIRLMTSPWSLVQYDVHNDTLDYLWPRKMHLQLEEYEGPHFQHDGRLYLSRWMEDPDYHEEIIVRDAMTGVILEREPGTLRRMPDGSIWKMIR